MRPGRGWTPPASRWFLATLATAAATAVGAVIAPDVVDLPQVSSPEPVVAPVAALLGWVAALAATTAADEPCPDVFATAPRRAYAVNLARVPLTLAALVCAAAIVAGARPMMVAALSARTSLALTGEGLATASVAGLRYCWLPMTAHLLASATFGAANRPDLASWAWVVSAEVGPAQLTVSALLFVTGVTAWGVRARTVLSERG